MIVDKSNDLNVYKEIRFDREREEKVGGKDMRLACCGVGEAGATEKTGCGAVDACGTQLSKFTADVDFNEWVGESYIHGYKPSLFAYSETLTTYAQVHSTYTLLSPIESVCPTLVVIL